MPQGEATPDDPAADSEGASDTDVTLAADGLPLAQVEAVPSIGGRVDRYRLLEELGRGASGIVFAAFDPKLDRKVALKLLRVAAGSGESSPGGRMLAEAKALAKLSHPNVVAVFDVGTTGTPPTGERVFVSMEFVEGRDLAAWISDVHMTDAWRRGRRWREIVDVFVQAARGLAAAHQAGIVHRDFKPGNVLVGEDGRVRVVDFGLARAKIEPCEAAPSVEGVIDIATEHGALQGTPAYLAPERISGEDATPASDQYAFCVALFEALLGRRPFVATTVPALLAEHLEGKIVWPPNAPPVPPWLERTLVRGLAKDPSQRHASMGALIDALGHDPRAIVRRVAGWLGIAGSIAAVVLGVWWLRQPGHVEIALSSRSGTPLSEGAVAIGEHVLEIRDGVAVGDVPAGKYTVTATVPDHRPAETVLDVSRGSTHQLTIMLDHERAVLDLDVEPSGATILVDGIDRGSRLRNLELDSGPHAIRAFRDGHFEASLELDLAADSHTRRFAFLPRVQAWSLAETGVWGFLVWAGDLDGDRRSEVIHRNYLHVLADDPWAGDRLWSMEFSDHESHAFALFDVDADGALDMVVSTAARDRGALAVYDSTQVSDGAPIVRWRAEGRVARPSDAGELPTPMMPRPTDTNGDGGVEMLVAPAWTNGLELRDAKTGRVLASREIEEAVLEARVVGDVAFVLTERGLEGWRLPELRREWRTGLDPPAGVDRAAIRKTVANIAERGASMLVTARLDDDEHRDVLAPVAAADRRVVLVATDGRTGARRWKSPPLVLTMRPFDVEPFDADGDGIDDLFLDTEGGAVLLEGTTGAALWTREGRVGNVLEVGGARRLTIVRQDGVELVDPATGERRLFFPSDEPVLDAPVLSDLDADGEPEVVFPVDGSGMLTFAIDGARERTIRLRGRPTEFEQPADHDGDGLDDLLANANGPLVLRATNLRWAQPADDAIRTTPVIADLDADGTIEVAVVGAFAGHADRVLTIFDADSGLMRAQGEAIEVIRDFDVLPSASGGLDLLLQTTRDIRIVSGRDASVIASRPTPQSYSSPGLGDYDGDGAVDIVAVPWNENESYLLLDGQLELRAEIPMPFPGSWARPKLVDSDGRGALELLGGFHDGHIALMELPGGEVRWSRSMGAIKVTHTPVPADLDGDGDLELVASDTEGHTLRCLSARDGTVLWTAQERGHAAVQVVVTDVDADGDPEIAAPASGAGLCLLDAQGGDVWCQPEIVRRGGDAIPVNAITVAPLASGSAPALLATFADGTLVVFDAASGARRWTYSPSDGARYDTRPAVADVDGDGTAEIFLAGWDRQLRSLHVPSRGGE